MFLEALKEAVMFVAFLILAPVAMWVLCEGIAAAVKKWKGWR